MILVESLKNLICIILGFVILFIRYNIFVCLGICWVVLFGDIFGGMEVFEF